MDSSAPKAGTESGSVADPFREKLNLIKVCFSYSWGGLEQVAAADAVDLGSQGIKVRLLCLEGTPIHEQLAHRAEVGLIPLDFRPRNYFDLKLRGELMRRLSEGANLIHAHQTSLLGSICPWIISRPEVAMIATRHIMNSHDKRNVFHRFIYSRLDTLLVMSQALKRNVLATHPISERVVEVVHLGLDFDRFDPRKVDALGQRSRWGADRNTVVIGLVGRIDPAKGQATFIRAAAGLLKSKRATERLKFVIVGEETLGSAGDYLSELKAMVDQYRLGDTVIFAGYQENIPEVMRSFDIFVMPSRQEAFGLVAIEAMAMECPIVISNGGSADEIVGQDRENPSGRGARDFGLFGLTMRADDAFDLQTQLRYLLDHRDERAEMGRRAREHAVRNYDRKNRIQKTLKIYERALRSRGAL